MVALPAEIDYGNWEEVRSRLLGALRPDAAAVVIDLTSTVFCDSAGLASLARACRAAADRSLTACAVPLGGSESGRSWQQAGAGSQDCDGRCCYPSGSYRGALLPAWALCSVG